MASLGVGLVFVAGYLLGSSREGTADDRQDDEGAVASAGAISASGGAVRAGPGDSPGVVNATVEERSFEVLRKSDSLARLTMWTELIMNASDAELREIGAAAHAWYMTGGVVGREVELLDYRHGQVLGSEMFDNLTKDSNGKVSLSRLRNMRGWASVSPDEARAWLEELPDGTLKSKLRDAWFGGLVAESPERAAELFTSLPPENRGQNLDKLYSSLHRFEGMDSVVDWFMDTAGGDGIDGVNLHQAFRALTWRLGALGAGDPGAVEEVLLRPEVAPFLTGGAFAGATRNAAGHNPGRVIDLIAELSERVEEGELRDMRHMVSQTVKQSTLSTIHNLGHWLQENPDHPLYDMTTRYFVEQAAREDPEGASDWAKTIGDPALAEEVSGFLIE